MPRRGRRRHNQQPGPLSAVPVRRKKHASRNTAGARSRRRLNHLKCCVRPRKNTPAGTQRRLRPPATQTTARALNCCACHAKTRPLAYFVGRHVILTLDIEPKMATDALASFIGLHLMLTFGVEHEILTDTLAYICWVTCDVIEHEMTCDVNT